METFHKWQDKVIGGFNKKNWLAADVSKVVQGSVKGYVNSCFLIRVIEKKGDVIGILHQTTHNDTKGINSMFTTICDMGQDLQNMGKYMEYYADKLHQVEKRVEVSNIYPLWRHKIFTLTQLKLCRHSFDSYCYDATNFLSTR